MVILYAALLNGVLLTARVGESAFAFTGLGASPALQAGTGPDLVEDVEECWRGAAADAAHERAERDGEGDAIGVRGGVLGVLACCAGPDDLHDLVDDEQRVQLLGDAVGFC